MTALSFPKELRIRKRRDFLVVQRTGGRFNRGGLLLLLKANGLGRTRLGITITRKAYPLATRRNYLRRLIREAFRRNQHTMLKGWDLVIIVTRRAYKLDLRQAEDAITWAMKRAEQGQVQ